MSEGGRRPTERSVFKFLTVRVCRTVLKVWKLLGIFLRPLFKYHRKHQLLHQKHKVLHGKHQVLHGKHQVLYDKYQVLHGKHQVLHGNYQVLCSKYYFIQWIICLNTHGLVFDHVGCFLVKILGTNELGTNKLLDGVYLGFPEVNKLL